MRAGMFTNVCFCMRAVIPLHREALGPASISTGRDVARKQNVTLAAAQRVLATEQGRGGSVMGMIACGPAGQESSVDGRA